MTKRKIKEFWTEVKRVLPDANGEPVVKETTCCCARPGASARDCMLVAGHKSRCGCFGHSKRRRWGAKRRKRR